MTTIDEKVVRANFTVLQSDLDLIAQVKKKRLLLGIETISPQLVRVAIDALSKLSETKLRETIVRLPKPKVGGRRPSKNQD